MAASDAKPFPKKNEAYRVTFPIFDADGDLVSGAADLDSEISKDGGTFADCTNEATEIATSSGIYYLDLTSTEMNADTVAIIVKTSTSGAKTTPLVMYPVEDGDIPVNVRQIEGADPSDTIRDAVVDDATRIDASALNTLSGHDPGATLSSLTTAQVNAEVVDALGTDTIAEMSSGAPTSTPTIKQALMYLYMALRNDTVATRGATKERRIKNDAGTVIAKATTTDDGSVFSQGKLGAP